MNRSVAIAELAALEVQGEVAEAQCHDLESLDHHRGYEGGGDFFVPSVPSVVNLLVAVDCRGMTVRVRFAPSPTGPLRSRSSRRARSTAKSPQRRAASSTLSITPAGPTRA